MPNCADVSPSCIRTRLRIDGAWLAAWVAVGVVALLAIARLYDFPYKLSWIDAFEGVRAVAGSTVWAALRVWGFWAISTVVIGGVLLRGDPDLESIDALLLGATGWWVLAPLIGNLLGPVGWLSGASVWGMLAIGAAWLFRSPPRVRLSAPSTGQKLALLAVALLAVSYLPLQLASPVVPFMDVLSYPASVQRILTFHVYLPFNNDPYGCWGRYAATPYLELFYAILALGSGVRPAALAESAAMMPMAALLIFSGYRLGKTLFGDTAGGVASLLLFATCLFRRAQGMRGTAVALVLVGLGLAYLIDRQRRRVTLAAGAAMFGAAVGSHAIIGAFGMLTAGLVAVLWLAEEDFNRVIAGAVALLGASLYAIPEILIGLNYPLPYPALPLMLVFGGMLIWAGTRVLNRTTPIRVDTALWIGSAMLIAGLLLLTLIRHTLVHDALYDRVTANLPMLALSAFIGLAVALLFVVRAPLAYRNAAFAAIPLLLALLVDAVDPAIHRLSHDAATSMMTDDINIKLTDYWAPYFLIFPAGFLAALAYRRWSAPITFAIVLIVLIYPWRQLPDPVDYDSLEHAVSEQWAFNLHTAAVGYWILDEDHHRKLGPDGSRLMALLNREIAAGRITTATHILHLTDTISSWTMVPFSVFVGINDDPIEYRHDPNNQWEGGSRVRGPDQLPAAIGASPPYILIQDQPPASFNDPPDGYDQIYLDETELENGRYPTRLYRRRDLAALSAPPARPQYRGDGFAFLLLAVAGLIFFFPSSQPDAGPSAKPETIGLPTPESRG
jgi:hypothetical protein